MEPKTNIYLLCGIAFAVVLFLAAAFLQPGCLCATGGCQPNCSANGASGKKPCGPSPPNCCTTNGSTRECQCDGRCNRDGPLSGRTFIMFTCIVAIFVMGYLYCKRTGVLRGAQKAFTEMEVPLIVAPLNVQEVH